MKSLLTLFIIFITHSLLAIEPPEPNKDLWIAAYNRNSFKVDDLMLKRKPFSTDSLILNKLIDSYVLYRCGNLAERDATLKDVDELIESQYLDKRKLDFDIKKAQGLH